MTINERVNTNSKVPPYPPTTASVRKDKEPYIPPVPPSTEYVRKRPPEPPKLRCLADESGYETERNKEYTYPFKIWIVASLLVLFANLYIITRIGDMRVDPKRTDHAVQAGIRECERTLPRTQTCELSELSFKVVEKKQW